MEVDDTGDVDLYETGGRQISGAPGFLRRRNHLVSVEPFALSTGMPSGEVSPPTASLAFCCPSFIDTQMRKVEHSG